MKSWHRGSSTRKHLPQIFEGSRTSKSCSCSSPQSSAWWWLCICRERAPIQRVRAAGRHGLKHSSATSGSCCCHQGDRRAGSFASTPHGSSSHPLTLHCLDVVPRPVPKPHQIQFWCIFLEMLWITFPVPVCPWVWFIVAFVRSDFCVFRAWAGLPDRFPLPILWSLGL